MRRYKANYWVTLLYNGVVCGIWPAAGAAYVLATFQRAHTSFALMFFLGMCLWVPFFMWLFHAVIWRRRKRQRSVGQSERARR